MESANQVISALTSGPKAGLVMDFDGVLSPITDDPAASDLLPDTAAILAHLATRLPLVALLSGRPVRFLADRAGIPGVELHGSYGLERLTAGGVEQVPEADRWNDAVAQATALLHEEFDGIEGIHVEDKSLAVAVHWRRAPDQEAAISRITPVLRRATETFGLRREPGKMVEELRMPVDQDKGTALRSIIRRHGLVVEAYAGDDRGDLPAFAAAAAAGGHCLVVDGADAAPEVAAVPGSHFDGPEHFRTWLQCLGDALG
ncbi:trehalose-phosphatase [Arthrobacter sp. CP30]